MKTKNNKRILDTPKSIRFTSDEVKELEKKASELGMNFNAFVRDKAVGGKERTTYAKKLVIKSKVLANTQRDRIYELFETTPSDFVSKEQIRKILEETRKECDIQ